MENGSTRLIFLEIGLHIAPGFNIFHLSMLSMLNSLFSQFVGDLPALGLAAAAVVAGTSVFWAWGILRRQYQTARSHEELPFVSVVVAGRNEEPYVGQCLSALLALDYPSDRTEILFVDDHSTDQTLKIARELAHSSSGRLQVFEATDALSGYGPKKHALTEAIRRTHGEIVLFTDADGDVQPGWAKAMVGRYDKKTGAVAGPTLPPVRSGFGNRMYRLERFMTAYASASALGYGHPASVTGQNFSFRRQAFEDIGGYACPTVASGDDDLMAQAIARHGWKVKFANGPEALVADLRPPMLRAQMNAAARHQSTTRYYPIGWRIAFVLTILSGIALLILGGGALFSLPLLALFLCAVITKSFVDAGAAMVFSRRIGARLSVTDLVFTELLLPFYLILRPLMLLRPSFVWRGRSHARTVPSASAAS